MHEDIPQIAEHAFGYSTKAQVVVDNPIYAVMLGLQRYGWMTFDQCKLRIFSWSKEYANNPAPCHKTLVQDTLKEMKELGLITIEVIAENEVTATTTQFISKIYDANPRITKRYNHCKNDGE